MECSQILPGAVSPGPCSVATGYYTDQPFIVYASGKDVVILDGTLKHLQTILGSSRGYSETAVSCVHCSESTGRIVAVWGCDVVVLQPELRDETVADVSTTTRVSSDFPGQWLVVHTEVLSFFPKSITWNRKGTHLLVGGSLLSLWLYDVDESLGNAGDLPSQASLDHDKDAVVGVAKVPGQFLKELWQCAVAHPIKYLKFSPDGAFFASAGENDRLVKVWYQAYSYAEGLGTTRMFSFTYIAHPQAVTGFVWRQTSTHMPRGYVPNVLLTYCKDNICRLWSHSVSSNDHTIRLRFFIVGSIDPIADVPFRTTLPVSDLPFTVHWLNNKSTAFTNKAEKYHAGAMLPISRYGSVMSFGSCINEEMLQSWVCIDDRDRTRHPGNIAGVPSSPEVESLTSSSHSLPNFLSLSRGGNTTRPSVGYPPSPLHDSNAVVQKRALAHLMDDWNSSPDLLLCIHPSQGSLMVWTVEGLDAPPNACRLVHISFSSCLPHIFPPHLAQSLRQEFLQFIIKEPDAVHSKVATTTSGNESISDFSLPVPSIRLPGGSMANMTSMENLKSTPKSKPESTLYLISSHRNGSINTWSVELTSQSNNSTSIGGLIHCGGTGGHHSKVRSIQRHPWLPIVMTVSTQCDGHDNLFGEGDKGGKNEGKCAEGLFGDTASELIIWNAELPGPLAHKSRLNELSRMFSNDPTAFQYVTWVPPISMGGEKEDVFARCPSSGLFVANIGKELYLFQSSLYCANKSPPSPSNQTSANEDSLPPTSCPSSSHGDSNLTISSQLGKEGVMKICVIDKDISKYGKIISIHSFRLCSLVTSCDIKKSLDSKFCKDVMIVILQNKACHYIKTILHMWRVTICMRDAGPLVGPHVASDSRRSTPRSFSYTAAVAKVCTLDLPLSSGSHVLYSSLSCDIASSLQLQLPTLSAPFIFTTVSTDSIIQCWQFRVKSTKQEDKERLSNEDDSCGCACDRDDEYEFELYEVFGSHSPQTASGDSISCLLDCSLDETIAALPTKSCVPSGISTAYPGRFAMAHYLYELPDSERTMSKPSAVGSDLDQYAVVTIWECESSGGLKWGCEASLFLSAVSGVLPSKSDQLPLDVLMEWLPMENGAYLLATCYATTISIYGMRLPCGEGELMMVKQVKGYTTQSKLVTLARKRSQASWRCLVQFPCYPLSFGLTISCFMYTGSNSLMVSIGTEVHLFSCWVREDQLLPLCSDQRQAHISRPASHIFHNSMSQLVPDPSQLDVESSQLINLLDYAHMVNTPLAQYHPKILTELMNSGKLHSVKAILVNLVKYLLLYSQKEPKKGNYFDEGGFDAMYGSNPEDDQSRRRLLSVSSDGILKRSQNIKSKTIVEGIPHLSLAKMGILKTLKDGLLEVLEDVEAVNDGVGGEDEYDELFRTNTLTEMEYEFTEEDAPNFFFSDIDPGRDDFSPDLARKLSSILRYAQLGDLTDLDQVRLLAIAETVANTKMSFSDQSSSIVSRQEGGVGLDFGTSTGTGYAVSGIGVGGGEAMDDCGLRYLLALQNYLTLSESLPDDISSERLPSSDFIWAFHSEAEVELLAAIPCVHSDKLVWVELRNVGVGWWLRSSDKLRTLIERLAKAQFMEKQEPLNALLFYLALKKQSLVKGLFRTIGDQKMYTFFSNDFQTARWKKAALKNAFSLLGKQRFEEAAAFFLLAGKLWDAVEVCVSRLHDLQLAFVVTRLYDGDRGPVYQRLLKEFILGEPSDHTPSNLTLEPSPDPFLRSITCWLLEDFPGALNTLFLSQHKQTGVKRGGGRADQESSLFNPAIFNFYFFLRTHPVLIRRSSKFQQQPHSSIAGKKLQNISNVGEESLTPAERNLLFSTAYFHLCHGCPLLALNVLSKLPKSSGLSDEDNLNSKEELDLLSEETSGSTGKPLDSMIQSGIISEFGHKETTLKDDEDDWSQPVASNRFADDIDDTFDWSQPVASNRYDKDDEFDWSQPVTSSCFMDEKLSPPNLDITPEESNDDETDMLYLNHKEVIKSEQSNSTLSTRGLFILSLAEQLQYNACLSILTEELITAYIPPCCQYLWNTKGKDALPLLPLPKLGKDNNQSLSSHFEANAFEQIFSSLRGLLVTWLKEETKLVKEICGFELSEKGAVEESVSSNSASSVPAGYDLLTTLMNYVSLHASTSPSLHTIHIELMNLMNTLLPWGTGVPPSLALDADSLGSGTSLPHCAVDPSQLPILTSSSLPAKHLTNLALHLRLLSASVITTLSNHVYPPTAAEALPNVDKVYELCCALSCCMKVCLTPTKFTDFTAPVLPPEVPGTVWGKHTTPIPSGIHSDSVSSDSPPLSMDRKSAGEHSLDHTFSTPNTKPSKWPGLSDWPSTLSSDEGKDPAPLSLVLVECLVSVYLGLLSVAWSQHSISDILLLLKNAPSGSMWYETFGGGLVISEKIQHIGSRSRFLQSIQTMTKRFRNMTRSTSSEPQSPVPVSDLFVPPKRTLLNCYLSASPSAEKGKCRDNKDLASQEGYLVCGAADEEDEDTETEDFDESINDMPLGKGGPMFRVGSVSSEPDSVGPHNDPNSFAWCLMNLCISKLLISAVKKLLMTAGVEVLELITASPLIYSTIKMLEEWESIFTRRLISLGPAPVNLFGDSEDSDLNSFRVGPALTRHKFILEKGVSPFRGRSKLAKQAKLLWQYLVHRHEVLETFIQYLFTTKTQVNPSPPSRSLNSLAEEEEDVVSLDKSRDRMSESSECLVVYKENDSNISSFCVNSCSQSNCAMIALAVPREVLEIEAPDTSLFDSLNEGDAGDYSFGGDPQRSKSMQQIQKEDFVMVQSSSTPQRMGRPQSTMFLSSHSRPIHSQFMTPPTSVAHRQTGQTSSLLLKRNIFGVKKMAPHPTLAYYLTGSIDGSVMMWEFGTAQPVSVQRGPGMGANVTMLRFTPEGNKFGATDSSGKLSLWQGIHTMAKVPYHTLHSGMKSLTDFLFLGSSSFIATCGDGVDNRNVFLWDTLLPTKKSIVKEFVCHDAGVVSLGYSQSKQRLFCGDKKGEVLIFDIKQMTLLQSLVVHGSAVNRIIVDDIEGIFATGSADGDIKVLDSNSLEELAVYPGEHAKSRLFRHVEGGVTDMDILPGGKLYSCGADGSVKCRTIVL